jgi:transcriptional regulator with XRE-family HTH domain
MSDPVPVRSSRRSVDADHVRAARLARGITQAELAHLLDVTVMTVSRRETGASPVWWEIWLGTAAALGLPIDWKPGDQAPAKVTGPDDAG